LSLWGSGVIVFLNKRAAGRHGTAHQVRAARLAMLLPALGPLLIACAGLPAAGPNASEVISQAVQNGRPQFEVIDVDQHVTDALAAQPVSSFHFRVKATGLPPEQTISVGDVIAVTIYQAIDTTAGTSSVGQPLSSIPPQIVVPDQIVMRDGTIVVPGAGRIRLVGVSPTKAGVELQNRLKDQLIKPQVIVSIKLSDANTVTVSGEGASGSRVPISPRGTRLLEAIATAGGVKSPTYELLVSLTRGGVTATVPYDTLVADPAENIYAHPGDIITLIHAPATFAAFGAAGKPLQYQWGADSITLAQALAITSGLDDSRADPAGVFLMRYEPQALVQEVVGTPSVTADARGLVPVVFHLNLSNVDSYLLAERFAMKDKDTIYVAGAPLNTVQKLLSLVGQIAYPVFTGYSTFSTGAGTTTAVIATPVVTH
jgi:polysaccharide biosynthesis/export protein